MLLKDAASCTERITQSSVNNLFKANICVIIFVTYLNERKHFHKQFLLLFLSLIASLFLSSVCIFVI